MMANRMNVIGSADRLIKGLLYRLTLKAWVSFRPHSFAATSAPANASCAKGNAAFVSSGAGAGWRRCADDLRTSVRFLHRPDRKEAAEPLLSRHERVVVRDSGLQPRLPVF